MAVVHGRVLPNDVMLDRTGDVKFFRLGLVPLVERLLRKDQRVASTMVRRPRLTGPDGRTSCDNPV